MPDLSGTSKLVDVGLKSKSHFSMTALRAIEPPAASLAHPDATHSAPRSPDERWRRH
jgi:hypothetical protein